MRAGYKESLVMKAGIKITPIGLGKPGCKCQFFRIEVTKLNSKGKYIEVKGSKENKRYPRKGSATEPSVWDKINEIYDYYYRRLTSKTAAKGNDPS